MRRCTRTLQYWILFNPSYPVGEFIMKTTLVSYYCDTSWSGTYYRDSANRLWAACQEFKVPARILPLTHPGTWVNACLLKPKFILSELRKFEAPVLWVDCDCNLVSSPSEVDELDCDIAVVPFYFDGKINQPHCIRSSAIFFNTTGPALDFVNSWAKACEKGDAHFNDHEYLILTYHRFKHFNFAKIVDLPEAFCWTPITREMKDRSRKVIELGLGKNVSKAESMDGQRKTGLRNRLKERISKIYG